MNGIEEILKSGIAPGVRCGQALAHPESVDSKAPKAFREIELGYGKGKRPVSARDIAKHCGCTVDLLKKWWSKDNPKAFSSIILAFALMLSSVHAGPYLVPGENLADGQTVHASDLMNLVGNAVLSPTFITTVGAGTYANGDVVMLYSSTGGTGSGKLYYTTLQNIIQNPNSITLLPYGVPNYTNSDLFSFYSASGTNLEAVTFSNLVAIISTNINIQAVPFALTNSSGSNVFVLQPWQSYSPTQTNNQPEFLIYSTNGVPYQTTLSNLVQNVAPYLGTNLSLGYVFAQTFQPWTVYGTNTYGFTNEWGYQTNFAITNLFMPGTNAPTLTNIDSIPIYSTFQKTNTTTTLYAVYQYLTNLNALPAYTVARIQYSGIPATIAITNMTASGIFTNAAAASNWTTPTAVALQGSTSGATLGPGGGILTSNKLLYVQSTNTTPLGFQIFTNYVNAIARTNPIVNASGISTTVPLNLIWCTNYTSFNADVIYVSSGTSLSGSVYDVFFRNGPAANALYYITGNCEATASQDVNFYISSGSVPNVNYFQVQTAVQGTGGINSPLVHILVNPQ